MVPRWHAGHSLCWPWRGIFWWRWCCWLLCPVLYLETPLRLYGLLGIVLGATLYAAGVMPVAEALLRRVKKCLPGLAQKEGNPSKGAKT